MARITIGDDVYEIPELNFVAVERAWPLMVTAMEEQDPMKAVSAAIGAIAAGIMETEGFDPERFGAGKDVLNPNLDRDDQVHVIVVSYLKKRLKAKQIGDVRLGLNEIIGEAGLMTEVGEADQVEEEMLSPSPETAAASLQSSSPPDVKAGVGTG